MTSPTPTVHSGSSHSLHVKRTSTDGPIPTTGAIAPSAPGSPGGKVKKERKDRAPPPGVAGLQAPIEISRTRFWLIFLSLMFSVFLFALDQLIVATAIPAITAEFNSLTKLSWLTSGFFLTLLGFNLLYSQWNQIFPSKHVILFAIFIFEVGSLVCGVAPSMDVLILGRAIAGVGAAGIFSGGMIILAELTSLHDRPKYFGLFGVCFAIASVIGPLVGGAFSDHVSWRWCFYINLPFGGLAIGLLFLFQPSAPPLGRKDSYKGYSKEMLWQVLKCDWLGAAISMGWACCLILALQWGGVTKKWNDGSVIACLVLTGVLPPVFVLYEWWLGENAMFKLKLLRRRTMIGACITLFCLFGTFMIEVYFLSVAFQAAYHTSATNAGVKLLPLILVQVATLIASSRIIPKIGRYKWVIVAGPCFTCLGSGLLYIVKHGTPQSYLYGFEVLLGVGIGMALQNSMIAVQFELKREPWLISAGTGLSVFLGFAGRIIGISLATSVFENRIQVNLHKFAPTLPEPLVMAVVNSATAVWEYVPANLQEATLRGYIQTLREVYIIGVPFSIIGVAGALLIKDEKMQTKEQEQAAIAAAKEKEVAAKAGVAAESGEGDVIRTEREAEEAQGVAVVGAGGGGVEATQIVADGKEGRTAA